MTPDPSARRRPDDPSAMRRDAQARQAAIARDALTLVEELEHLAAHWAEWQTYTDSRPVAPERLVSGHSQQAEHWPDDVGWTALRQLLGNVLTEAQHVCRRLVMRSAALAGTEVEPELLGDPAAIVAVTRRALAQLLDAAALLERHQSAPQRGGYLERFARELHADAIAAVAWRVGIRRQLAGPPAGGGRGTDVSAEEWATLQAARRRRLERGEPGAYAPSERQPDRPRAGER